ncbi:uncharacterized protein LOC100842845 [Brachypodium distachyon]|uniref:Uncharacterized protein n=1 Tax=Brachypodium distachyon TaxID=15368 RepID=I1HT10_BRADI|nr:uncharacterized protein LOC100842845 [Brachypodium distachyon]KQK10405.1 hypothetical protein BRADI_2g53930v3 [Brachypodium distachyon]|eukprot:XP_003567243.1 uncharacterized protein LOC100842845 [Brachypodium distachyon]
MDISHIIAKRPKERRRYGDHDRGEQQLPQPLLELDSPLPTPRRSCASADHPRCRRDASPLRVRTRVPFSWESSPGVPKSRAVVDVLHKNKAAPETTMPMPPPKPPPGRCTSSRNWRYGNASDCDTHTSSFFSVHNRTVPSSSSSPDQRAIGSGSFDRVTSKRFEDIFLGRASSFVKDERCHSRHALSDASSSSGRSTHHPKQWRRRHDSTGDDDDGEPPPNTDPAVQEQIVPRIKVRPRVEQMSPRACGLMVFFPWSAKPAVCGGFRSPSSLSQRATPRSSDASDRPVPSSRSHSRRSTTTLRDALQEENKTEDDGDIGQAAGLPRGEKKRNREEWQGRGWGVSSLLGTSKKYCTDARKALSKLSIGLGSESGSPRVGRERNDRKLQDVPTTPAMTTAAAKLTKIRTSRN